MSDKTKKLLYESKRGTKNPNSGKKLSLETNIADLWMTFQNGSTIYLYGAKDESDIDKFRGLPFKLLKEKK